MAGVERVDGTCPQAHYTCHSKTLKTGIKKGSSISARALCMAGVERVDGTCPQAHYTCYSNTLKTGIKKAPAFLLEPYVWQGWRDSNSQHADLESAALPIGATPLFRFNETILENKWRIGRDSNPRPPA